MAAMVSPARRGEMPCIRPARSGAIGRLAQQRFREAAAQPLLGGFHGAEQTQRFIGPEAPGGLFEARGIGARPLLAEALGAPGDPGDVDEGAGVARHRHTVQRYPLSSTKRVRPVLARPRRDLRSRHAPPGLAFKKAANYSFQRSDFASSIQKAASVSRTWSRWSNDLRNGRWLGDSPVSSRPTTSPCAPSRDRRHPASETLPRPASNPKDKSQIPDPPSTANTASGHASRRLGPGLRDPMHRERTRAVQPERV